ncbi:MAG: S8 family serine peptidase [Bacteriovoracaceae bacterium]|nr:S8 family serine peptidase [Bacteriovoracaceae bacterium]
MKSKRTMLYQLLAKTIITALILTGANAQAKKRVSHHKYSVPVIKNKIAFKRNMLTSKYASWGISPFNNKSSINLENAWERFKEEKKEIVVAVIDTGIDPNHNFLAKNIFLHNGKISQNRFGLDFSKNSKNKFRPIDTHGHGTHVSGIIKSVYPDVKLLVLKYFNPEASGKDNLNSTIEALRYAVNAGVDIINYSGGGPEPALEELRILKIAEKKGILIVAASGNEESNIDIKSNAYYPASYGLSNIVTVSAYDENLNILAASNYGKHSVDIFAPGYRIKSSLPNNRSGYRTGTSQATAFVSGVAAMIKAEHPKSTAHELKNFLISSAQKEANFVGKCRTGGRVDASAALRLANKYYDTKTKRSLANKSNLPHKQQGKIHYRIAN